VTPMALTKLPVVKTNNPSQPLPVYIPSHRARHSDFPLLGQLHLSPRRAEPETKRNVLLLQDTRQLVTRSQHRRLALRFAS